MNIIKDEKENYLHYLNITNSSHLCIMVFLGKTNLVKTLLLTKPDVNHKNIFGLTPIFHAIAGKNYKCANLLIKNGADINHIDTFGNRCLYYELGKNNHESINFLVGNNITINDTEKEYNKEILQPITPYTNLLTNIKILIDSGCDIDSINIKTEEELTAEEEFMLEEQGEVESDEEFIFEYEEEYIKQKENKFKDGIKDFFGYEEISEEEISEEEILEEDMVMFKPAKRY
jgi:ankyrin repeat protein